MQVLELSDYQLKSMLGIWNIKSMQWSLLAALAMGKIDSFADKGKVFKLKNRKG